MTAEKVLLVIDVQNGVFAESLFDPAGRLASINQLIAAADQTLFIQHADAHMTEGSDAWQLLADLHRPANAQYLTKTACDAFYETGLDALLQQLGARELIICGCMTDFCVDTTIKNGASKGYELLVAGDAHTTVDSAYASAQQLIAHHNQVWANLTIPGGKVQVRTSGEIVQAWSGVAA